MCPGFNFDDCQSAVGMALADGNDAVVSEEQEEESEEDDRDDVDNDNGDAVSQLLLEQRSSERGRGVRSECRAGCWYRVG